MTRLETAILARETLRDITKMREFRLQVPTTHRYDYDVLVRTIISKMLKLKEAVRDVK